MFELVQVQKSSEFEPKNGGAGLSQFCDISAPVPSIAPCKRRFNYPPADEMRGISHALGVYLAIRDNIQFDIEGTK